MASNKNTLKYVLELNNKAFVKSLKDAGVDTKKLEKELDGMTETGNQGFSSMTQSIGKTVVGIAAFTAAFAVGKKVLTSIIVEGAEFTDVMAKLAAVTNATAEDQQKLTDEALRLGKATSFTAAEVGLLATEYAKLGFSTDEILEITEATIDLATFTGDAAATAAVAGGTLRAYGLTAKEMPRILDEMAFSFSNSALDLEKYRESMKHIAPISKAFGLTTQQTTAQLMALADVQIYGTIAGTGLKNVYSQLKDEGSNLAQIMGGTADNFDEFVVLLKAAKERGQEFNDVALADMDKLLKTTVINLVGAADKLEGMEQALDGAGGAAKRMADQSLDSLTGKTKLLQSAISGLQIAIFQKMEDSLMGAVEGATELVTSLTPVTTELEKAEKAATEQRIALGDLSNMYFTLRESTNRTAAETELYKETIQKLKAEYPKYLKDLDLEQVAHNKVKKAIEETNKALEAKLINAASEAAVLDLVKEENDLKKENIELRREQARALTDLGIIAKKYGKTQEEALLLGQKADKNSRNRFQLGQQYGRQYKDLAVDIGHYNASLETNREEQLKVADSIKKVKAEYAALLKEDPTLVIDVDIKDKLDEKEIFIKIKPKFDEEEEIKLPEPQLIDIDKIAADRERLSRKLEEIGIDENQRFLNRQIEKEEAIKSGLEENLISEIDAADKRKALEQETTNFFQEQWEKRAENQEAASEKAIAKWKEENETILAVVGSMTNSVTTLASDLIDSIGEGAFDASEIFEKFLKNLLKGVINTVIQIGIQTATAEAISAIATSTAVATQTAAAAAIATAYAPAATLASIATFGVAAATGSAAVISSIGIVQGVTAATNFLEDGGSVVTAGSSTTFKGNRHSSGGIKGVFSDGTRVEVEDDEEMFVLNRKATKLRRGLNNLNDLGKFENGGSIRLGSSQAVSQVVSALPQQQQQNINIEVVGSLDGQTFVANIVNPEQNDLSRQGRIFNEFG